MPQGEQLQRNVYI